MQSSPVPAGPLAVRWLAREIEPLRAGAVSLARVRLENAGTAPWRPDGPHRIEASYHWLDERGNPIVWEGYWCPLQRPVAPDEQVELTMEIRAPIPPGRYRLSFDLVSESRFWFAEIGNATMDVDVEVAPRIGRRALAVLVDTSPGTAHGPTRPNPFLDSALSAQDEPVAPWDEAEAVAFLTPWVAPAPDWSRRVLDAHAEGYAVVGGAVTAAGGPLERRRLAAALEPWAPGGGRNPAFDHPLLCPSFLKGIEPDWTESVEGLPAALPPAGEPWIHEGRAVVRARRPGGRRRG
jgi:hypothetical protein